MHYLNKVLIEGFKIQQKFLENQTELEKIKAAYDAKTGDLRKQFTVEETKKVLGKVKKQEGGYISKEMADTSLFQLHEGEVVMSPESWKKADDALADASQFVASYLPHSGQQLNQLQMGRVGLDNAGGGTTQPVIVQDNTQAVQQHQHIHIPAPDGQTLPGERGNFVHKVG